MFKKLFIASAGTLFFLLQALAQAPLSIEASIEKSSGSLTIKVDHPVSDRQHRYIYRIEITVDDSAPVGIDLFFQKEPVVEQTINISDLEKAKKITITAYAKGGGTLTKDFDVKELLGPESGQENATAANVPTSEAVEK
jgi:hypothetical protein